MSESETARIYEELLVLLAQGGDRAAAARLAARWQGRLTRTARRLLQDDDAARDAVQDTWLAICAGLGRLREPDRFPAWAFGILHRKCADQIRRRQRSRRDAAEPAFAALDTERATRGQQEDGTALEQAFASLTPEHRAAAALFFGEGLTLREIAAATGVAVGTAKSRIFHARRRLKELLGDADNAVQVRKGETHGEV